MRQRWDREKHKGAPELLKFQRHERIGPDRFGWPVWRHPTIGRYLTLPGLVEPVCHTVRMRTRSLRARGWAEVLHSLGLAALVARFIGDLWLCPLPQYGC